MNKKIEKIYEIAESEGWKVDYSYTDEKETEIIFSFEKYSPAGRDFCFEVCVRKEEYEDIVFYYLNHAIYKYWEGFDVSYETYIWLDETGHGNNGAPYDMKDLYEDTQACADMIHDLWLAFNGKK